MTSFAVFDTPIGPSALVWARCAGDEARLTHVELPMRPDETQAELVARLASRAPEATPAAPPPVVASAIAAVKAHFAGQASSFEEVPLDLDRTPTFHRRVYEQLRRIHPGKTVTYAELAALAGSPGASRAVGQAMGANPWPLIVPCHRVLAAGGKAGGFSAPGGAKLKAQMLEIEGVSIPANRQLSFGETV